MTNRAPSLSARIGDQHLKAIGRIAAEWEQLLSMLRVLLGILSRLREPVTTILFTHTSTPQLLEMLEAVSRERAKTEELGPWQLDEILKVIGRTRDLQVQRNTFVHASWYTFGPDYLGIHKQTARGLLKTTDLKPTAEEMNAVAERIDLLTEDVVALFIALAKETAPLKAAPGGKSR